MEKPRPSPIAGTWYPGTREALARSIDSQLAQAHVDRPPGDLVAVVVPHAGHRYSGHIAALAFSLLRGHHPEFVAIVAPMHHPYGGRILTTGHPAYETPLGTIPVDEGRVAQVEAALPKGLKIERVLNDPEHSLEIELPFLQRCLETPFVVMPFMLRDQSSSTAEALGHALAGALRGTDCLLVASSDLSHFYPDPVARRFDTEFMRRLQTFDPAAVLQAEEEGVAFACGRGAVAAVLWAARDLGADAVHVLGYGNSGDITGDTSSVVGYGAAAVVRHREA